LQAYIEIKATANVGSLLYALSFSLAFPFIANIRSATERREPSAERAERVSLAQVEFAAKQTAG